MIPELLALPEEVINLVLENVARQKDRHSVSLTCKMLNRLNEPHLYRVVRPNESWDYDSGVQTMARVFLNRPQLCEHVEKLELSIFHSVPHSHMHGETHVLKYDTLSTDGAALLRSLRDRVKECEWPGVSRDERGDDDEGGDDGGDDEGDDEDGDDDDDDDDDENEDDDDSDDDEQGDSDWSPKEWFPKDGVQEDALVGILLTKFPRLADLHVIDYDTSFWLFGFINAALRQPWPSTFANLTTIHLEHWDDEGGVGMRSTASCLVLPSLRRFNGIKFQGYMEDDFPESAVAKHLEAAGSQVEHLELEMASVTQESLDALLRWTRKSLVSFVLTLGGSTIGYDDLYSYPLAASLRQAHRTLKRLTVTLDWNDEHVGVLAPLSPLTALEFLRLDFKIFENVQLWVEGRSEDFHGGDGRCTSYTAVIPTR